MFRRAKCDHARVDTVVFMSGPLDVGISGGDVHAARLCDALARQERDSVRLIAPGTVRAKLPSRVIPALIELRTPFDHRLGTMLVYFMAVTVRMIRALQIAPRSRVSVASSHFFFDVIPCALRRGACVSYVYHLVAESERQPSLRSWVSIVLEKVSLRILRHASDLIFVDNAETRAALLSRGFDARRISDTRNAYDPLTSLPPPSTPLKGSVVFCGRLVESKGVWDLIALARALQASLPNVTVTLIGDGPLRSAIHRVVSLEQLENVELPGFVSEAEKWRRLCAATLFVAPSREEGWGIAVGEALFAGVPALTYDLPAYRHFGSLPLQVATGDVDGFVRAAVALLSDRERLEHERRRVAAGAADLPRWHEIVSDEIAAMARLA